MYNNSKLQYIIQCSAKMYYKQIKKLLKMKIKYFEFDDIENKINEKIKFQKLITIFKIEKN